MLRRILDSPWLYFGLAGVLVVAAVLSQLEFRAPPRPPGRAAEISSLHDRDDLNVVFIVIDMLRADRLHTYGYARQTSPVLDKLAATGIRFANVESQSSWTKASMASLWTGMYPERTGIQRFFHAMPPEATTPAEILRDAGYRTAGIWRNGWVANNFGFDQGFDMYVRPARVAPEHKVIRQTPGVHSLPGTDMDATLSAIEYITGSLDRKFFLYIHYMDVHQYLYTDLSPDFGSSFSDFYDSSIFWADFNIGRIMETLQNLRLIDHTLVVIVSDHGEAFFEHGIEGHARNLYREVLTTPWIIALPFELDRGIVVQRRVANVDVWPTLLDMLGLPSLPGAEGESALPLILEAAEAPEAPQDADTDRPIFAQLDRTWGKVGVDPKPQTTVRQGSLRLNYYQDEPERTELFDHRDDPDEKQNIAAERPEQVEQLSLVVQEFLAKPKTQWQSAPEVELDEMRQNQLRALGYVVDRRRRPPAGADPGADEAAAGEAAAPGEAAPDEE